MTGKSKKKQALKETYQNSQSSLSKLTDTQHVDAFLLTFQKQVEIYGVD